MLNHLTTIHQTRPPVEMIFLETNSAKRQDALICRSNGNFRRNQFPNGLIENRNIAPTTGDQHILRRK